MAAISISTTPYLFPASLELLIIRHVDLKQPGGFLHLEHQRLHLEDLRVAPVYGLVRIFEVEDERRLLAESLAELVLLDVERGALTTDDGHLVGLQRRHLLFDGDCDFLGVIPLFWEVLRSNKAIQKSHNGSNITKMI